MLQKCLSERAPPSPLKAVTFRSESGEGLNLLRLEKLNVTAPVSYRRALSNTQEVEKEKGP